MEIKKILAGGVTLLILGVSIAPSITAYNKFSGVLSHNSMFSKRFYVRHRLIVINGNNDLTPRNGVVGGTGTEVDPYIISGWKFDGSAQYLIDMIRWKSAFRWLFISLLFGEKESAISISNTDKYIIIRDNYFVNWNEPTPPPDPWGHSPFPDHMAIAIGNAENIVIENNVISNCNQGIFCFSLAIIRNNSFSSITGGYYAVYVSARGTIVEHNTIQDCNSWTGIYFLDASSTAVIRNNSLENIDGYSIIGVNGVVENNVLVNCDIAIKVGNCTVRNNLVKSSSIGIGTFSQNLISHNELINNDVGIGCYWPPHNCTILDNIIQGNTYSGIYCIEGSRVQIHFNNIFQNSAGVHNCGGAVLNATLNWWGSETGPSGVGAGSGDTVSENVSYSPWLTSPNPDAGRE